MTLSFPQLLLALAFVAALGPSLVTIIVVLGLTGWERYTRQLKVMREAGLQTWASFVLGYDYETPDSVREVADFAMEILDVVLA